jgi:CDP-6-deoxy-D-xylo-4-hexulose-3-dehydrase
MVCSNDADLHALVRSLSWWGRDCRCVGAANMLPCGTCGKRFDKWLKGSDTVIDHKYVFTNVGYNLKPLDLQGAIGIAQMEKIDEIESKRRANKAKLEKIFYGDPRVRVAKTLPQADPCWFGVPLICSNRDVKESLVKFLEKNLIQTRPYFAGNILQHPAYEHLGNKDDYPNANTVMDTVFFIGCPPHYTEEIIDYITGGVATWRSQYLGEKDS